MYVTAGIHWWRVDSRPRGLPSSIDGTNNEHTAAIRHLSSSARTGWMEGWKNRQKENALKAMLARNRPAKILSDVCKAAYSAHLYKYAGPAGGGCGVASTQKKLRQNHILKCAPFPPESCDTYMAALDAMPTVLQEYRDTLMKIDSTKPEDAGDHGLRRCMLS